MHVDKGGLIVQQRHALAQTPGNLIVRQGKGMGLGWARCAQGRANERLLEVQGLVEIGARFSQGRQPTVESQ